MRITIPLKVRSELDPHALESQRRFLFRRVRDRKKAFLFVGEAAAEAPVFRDLKAVDWYYGHLQYDLREELGGPPSRHPHLTDLPLQHWAVPKWVVEWHPHGISLHVHAHHQTEALDFCDRFFRPASLNTSIDLEWTPATDRKGYLEKAGQALRSIQRGDIYEINYCTGRTARVERFDPFAAFARLDAHTASSFAAFHRFDDHFALCASPERFLFFDGSRVFAQPMKGTRPRSIDPAEDERLAKELALDAKERSENIMALDVARHDLSRIAASGSVRVEELCMVRPHKYVHQMTSTVAARMKDDAAPMDVIKAAFPMASMTGAPKESAMRIIDGLEDQRRGLFSGTLGYFAPDGTGDLNVVIRTIFHDARTGMIRTLTGSALTAACDPATEWEECELKARSVINALK